MSKLETTCPLCGHHDVLEFSQQADIVYRIIEGKLVPQLDENSIGWLDTSHLYCRNCGGSDYFNRELAHIKEQYDANL